MIVTRRRCIQSHRPLRLKHPGLSAADKIQTPWNLYLDRNFCEWQFTDIHVPVADQHTGLVHQASNANQTKILRDSDHACLVGTRNHNWSQSSDFRHPGEYPLYIGLYIRIKQYCIYARSFCGLNFPASMHALLAVLVYATAYTANPNFPILCIQQISSRQSKGHITPPVGPTLIS